MGNTISDGNNYQSADYTFQSPSNTGTETSNSVQFKFVLTDDTIASADFFSTIQFFVPTTYTADASVPTLASPETEEIGEQLPYGTTEQGMIKKFFSDQVISALKGQGLTPEEAETVYEAIMSGTVPADPNLAEIAKKISKNVTAKTITEGNLPASWTLTSTDAKDWTPLPILPYGSDQQAQVNEYYDQTVLNKVTTYLEEHALELDPDQAMNLMKAVQTGEVSSDIADIYIQLTAEARVETQKAFGLPNSWFKGTTTVDDWKPINVGLITPAKVANARLEGLLGNAEAIFTDISAAANALLDGPPPIPVDDPRRVALTEFLKIIGDAIKDLKATLREIQVHDAEKSKENAKAKFGELADRRLRAQEQAEKMEKMLKKQKQMKSMGLAMKIIGPIIAALSTIIGTLIAIASLGTATAASVAIIAAGVAVGIAMTAYSIADSVTGVTQKIITAFKDALDKLMPDSPDWVKSLVKALIVAAVVAVLAVIIVLAMASGSGAGAATNAASQAVQQTIRIAVTEAIKQMALQAMIMAIMSSNALPELVGGILKASGVDKKTQQIVEMVVMAITLIACVIAMAKVGGAKSGGTEQKAADAAEEATKEAAKTVTQRASDALKDFKSQLDNVKESIKKLPETMQQEFKSMMQGFKNLDKWDVLNAVAQSAPLAVQMTGGAITGSMQLKVSRLLKEVGEIKSAEEELEGLIQALEKLLKNIQQGMNNRDDFIAQLQQMYTSIYDAAAKTQNQMFNALQG
ncbi:type III secretion system translocon subunit SctE [Candidatus Protochlamydia amoebophila]|uniref:Translocator protein BipB-like C-terminal domain-containing protein n=1 Tax=Protochlamydia amoebophila (strain UWE25) TaxID=264201 RepID=Q6MBE0_PARUW|nr:type III secretion system translocon subunit SctE [Candidatus Protochlamydia amoebophila]CAF24109.1 unnamed protein product [Candidatus Protochlamydia amoebophila UWE25]